MFLNSQIDLII